MDTNTDLVEIRPQWREGQMYELPTICKKQDTFYVIVQV